MTLYDTFKGETKTLLNHHEFINRGEKKMKEKKNGNESMTDINQQRNRTLHVTDTNSI